MANLERLRAVLDWAEEQERVTNGTFVFEMSDWVGLSESYEGAVKVYENGQFKCGTAACLAGSAAVYTGQEILGGNLLKIDDGAVAIEDWAQEYFGLTFDQVEEIFYATHIHTVKGMKRYINEYFNKEVFPDVEWTPVELA